MSLIVLLCLTMLPSGCRRATPPSFTAGPEVLELTQDISLDIEEVRKEPDLDEDAKEELEEMLEELKLYEGLQDEIAVKLRELCGTPDKPILLGEEESTDQLKHGYALYTQFCVQCHGVNGDGNGAVAEHLDPKPRNYTLGVFKFTSTPYGSKPRRADLVRTVRVGVTGTSMPSFDRLSETEINAVVEYVLALTYRGQIERELASYAYDDEELPDEEGLEELVAEILDPWENSSSEIVMPVSVMPPMTEESVKIGHQIFLNKACNKCHGKFGRGGSMGNVEVGEDAWGNKAAAADLSSGMFHGGDRPVDLYRRIYSGINGTPMPAFKQTFEEDPDAIWHLVHFIKETGNRRRRGLPPLSEADMPVEETPAEETPAEEATAEEATAEEAETDSDDTESTDAEAEETEEADEEESAAEESDEAADDEAGDDDTDAAEEEEMTDADAGDADTGDEDSADEAASESDVEESGDEEPNGEESSDEGSEGDGSESEESDGDEAESAYEADDGEEADVTEAETEPAA